MSPATVGVVGVVKLKFTVPALQIVEAVVSVRVIVGAGSTITSIGANATPAQLDVPCNLGVNTKRAVAGSLPLLVSVPFRMAAPATNAWLVRFAKAVPATTPDPPVCVTVTSHLISPATVGVVRVVKLKFTVPALHIVDAVVSDRVIVGTGSTMTSTGAKATPAQLDEPCNLGVNTKRTVAGLLPLLVSVPFKVAAPAVNV